MNRRLWATVAAAVGLAALASVLGASAVFSRQGGTTGSPTSQVRQAFGFDAAYADPDPRVLVVRYGDSGSCPSLAVRHDVKLEPRRIVVTLTRTAIAADRPCTSDYRAKLVRISLASPLGSRTVIDGSRNAAVPISTGTPPFG